MTIANERKHLKMVIWTVLHSRDLIFDRTEGPGFTALHCAQNCLNSGLYPVVHYPEARYHTCPIPYPISYPI